MDYILSCCSPADMPLNWFTRRNVNVKYFKYLLGGTAYEDDCGQSISSADFYQAMRDGADTKTSQVNVEEFTQYFKELLSTGKDVLHVTLSSGISGTYNSARIAAKDVQAEFPERKIYVVDSLAASSGYGLFVDLLCDKRDEGLDISELYNYAEKLKLKINHWFYSTDLTFYIKGGRISKVSGIVGSILKICPVMNVSFEGKLIPRFKTMGKKKAMLTALDRMINLADNGINYNGKCFISHSDCLSDAVLLKNEIEEKFPALKGKTMINDIGTTIGCHSGPGTVALFFVGAKREN